MDLAEPVRAPPLTVKMLHGAAIEGRVFGFNSALGAGARVRAMQWRTSGGERTLMPAYGSSGSTDDLGTYRVFGLPPGDYVVMFPAIVIGGPMVPISRRSSSIPASNPAFSDLLGEMHGRERVDAVGGPERAVAGVHQNAPLHAGQVADRPEARHVGRRGMRRRLHFNRGERPALPHQEIHLCGARP
jgi:hypothetical protein